MGTTLLVLKTMPLTAVGKIFKPAPREEAARSKIVQVLHHIQGSIPGGDLKIETTPFARLD
jgi:hypothetical protein